MMRAALVALGLLATAPAHALDLHGEVSLELGLLGNTDDAWDLFSSHDVMGSYGVRVGYALNEHATLIAGWHHYSRGQALSTGLDDIAHKGRFHAAFSAEELMVGPKVGTPLLGQWLYPYVTAQAVAFFGVMRLDDDIATRHNPGQLREGAFAPGVRGMGGVELRLPFGDTLSGAVFTELGYGWIGRGRYGDLGAMRPGGVAFRSGLGLRF